MLDNVIAALQTPKIAFDIIKDFITTASEDRFSLKFFS
jgi:hypothetical protein